MALSRVVITPPYPKSYQFLRRKSLFPTNKNERTNEKIIINRIKKADLKILSGLSIIVYREKLIGSVVHFYAIRVDRRRKGTCYFFFSFSRSTCCLPKTRDDFNILAGLRVFAVSARFETDR